MKRDARIGLAVVLVLGLSVTLLVARSLHQRAEEMAVAEAAPPPPAATDFDASWTPETDLPTEPAVDPATQVQQEALNQFLAGRPTGVQDTAYAEVVDMAGPGMPLAGGEAAPSGPVAASGVYMATQTLPTQGQPPVPDQPGHPEGATQPARDPAEQIYIVVPGDNPWKISARIFGDGKYAAKIMEANPGADPNRLNVGQQLRIPNINGRFDAGAIGASTQPAPAPSAPAAAASYKIQPGDTLSAIAKAHYGSGGPKNVKRILDANAGLDPRRLKVGATIVIPQ